MLKSEQREPGIGERKELKKGFQKRGPHIGKKKPRQGVRKTIELGKTKRMGFHPGSGEK